MRPNETQEKGIVGHIALRIASRVVSVPVKAAPLDEMGLSEGFFVGGPNGYEILVDSRDSESKQRQAVERATDAAAKYLSRHILN
jgi:hypothetical protein